MTTVTVSSGPDATRVHESPDVIAVPAGNRVRLTTFERHDSGKRSLIASLEIPRDELYALLNVAPVKRARRLAPSVMIAREAICGPLEASGYAPSGAPVASLLRALHALHRIPGRRDLR
jgi:hypothetical protein